MARRKRLKAPDQILIDLVTTERERTIGGFRFSVLELRLIGAHLLTGTRLKPEHAAQALEKLRQGMSLARDRSEKAEFNRAIKVQQQAAEKRPDHEEVL